MFNRYFTVMTTVFVALIATAIVCSPLVAQTTIEDHRNASTGLAARDGSEIFETESEAGVKSRRSYARSNYLWPYQYGPTYSGIDVHEKEVVWTPAGVFNIGNGGANLPIANELKTAVKVEQQAGQVFVVQYHDEVVLSEEPLISVIESHGGRLLGSPNSGSVVAWLNRSAYQAVQSTVGFLTVEPYHAAFKLDSSIGRTPLPDPIQALSDVYTLEVILWDAADVEATTARVSEIGGSVVGVGGNVLTVELHRNQLAQIAQIDTVKRIHEQLPLFMNAEETSAIVQTATAPTASPTDNARPYSDVGITGQGLGRCANAPATSCTFLTQTAACGIGQICLDRQVIMVLDSGFSLDAGDLSNTNTDPGTAGPLHRKVRVHEATNQFGGQGDTSGCDAPPQGGFSHGHVVASTALGNATRVDTDTYGQAYIATDAQGNAWEIDGVAYESVLVAYDGQVTPPNGSCSDPGLDSIVAGTLYNGNAPANGPCPNATQCPGSLGKSYEAHGARQANFSWGSQSNTYSAGASQIDDFVVDKEDAMVFVSAGNYSADIVPAGGDGIPDSGTLGSPATTKNGLAVGASRNAGANSQESRAAFSSVGPAVSTTVNRIAPQIMAPGSDAGNPLGVASEFNCRSNDNDQDGPVYNIGPGICDTNTGSAGTSFASPAAAGTAALIRDYFRQGFHPDGVRPDDAAAAAADSLDIGSAVLKALMFASADFMTGANVTRAHRWNNEQGYGRVQVDNVLPLEAWARSPLGLLINDPFSARADLGLPFSMTTNQSFTTTFEVANDEEELRVALAWNDNETQDSLRNDINLTLISPSGIEYRGNYFTDDNDQDGVPEPNEDCGGIGAESVNVANGVVDQSRWSLPVCNLSAVFGKSQFQRPFDNSNPSEAIFLSPDPQGDDGPPLNNGPDEGTCSAGSSMNALGPCGNNLDCRTAPAAAGTCINYQDYQQTEIGQWTMIVANGPGTIANGSQEFAVVVAGGVALGSTVRFDEGSYTCNKRSVITITEVSETGTFPDAAPSTSDVSDRTTVRVIDGDPSSPTFEMVVDTETGLNFTQAAGGLKFTSDEIQLTDNTGRDPGNGVLDARDGDTLEVTYADKNVDTGAFDVIRKNQASVGCRVDIGFGTIVFGQFGQDTGLLVQGGCEINARGEFYFGFPDRYMDADESIVLDFAFNSNESEDLDSVIAELSCVNIDTNSPKDCLPTGAGCDETECGGTCDPRREDNTPCNYLTILDSPNFIGFMPAGAANSAAFSIQMEGDDPGEPFAPNVCLGDKTTPCTAANQATQCDGTPTGPCVLWPVPTIEFILSVEAAVSGQTKEGLAVARERLNVDPVTAWYSTDYPGGGSEVLDYGPGTASNNDEIAMDPVTENANFQSNDYRFETYNFSDLTATGKNLGLLSPWNFDGNNGGFTVGLAAPADETAADVYNIANWGEDKNFNNIEDGVCTDDPSIACYRFGVNTDARCPSFGGGNTGECKTVEDNLGGTSFTTNWNTRGGCGWQTRATGECATDSQRGCFNNADCLGTCQVLTNQIASTFQTCSGSCPPSMQCSTVVVNPNPLDPCVTDAECGGVSGACVNAAQTCVGFAGLCGGIQGDHTGGVWHTGQIGQIGTTCNGQAGDACANYKVITATGGQLLWWELLVSPVMEKVNQDDGPDGLPEASIEIWDFGYNSQINLSDNNVSYSWEIDTDLETLDPVDLFSDTTILGLGSGAYGAIAEGSNPDLTNGWPIFGTLCSCTTGVNGPCVDLFDCEAGSCDVSGDPCHVNADCLPGTCNGAGGNCFSDNDCDPGACTGGNGSANGLECHSDQFCVDIAGLGATCVGFDTCTATLPEGCNNAPTCDCTGGDTTNGSSPGMTNRVGDVGCFFEGNVNTDVFDDLGVAQPLDDDQDNDNQGGVDEYVQDDGPYRNNDIVAFNGPDMRFGTLEDIFGDTGNTFQAALGFINFEGTPSSVAQQSYGLAVDDMVVKWREFTFEPDVTDCATNGSCAVVELSTANSFEGQAVLTITVLDQIPDAANDCDLDGATDGTQDCSGNANNDVVVKATSETDVPGEIIWLEQQGSGSSEYKGVLTISALADGPGVLYVAQEGSEFPTVTVTYKDNNFDGLGNPCPNDVDVTKHGNIQSTLTVFLGSFCDVSVVKTDLTDNGDGDVFADDQEIVDMTICVINSCGVELTNCTARLFSNSDNVDCILDSTIDMGDLADNDELQCPGDAFQWKSIAVNRANISQNINANFTITMSCDQIDAVSTSQTASFPLDLDLDIGAQTPAAWTEGFEGGTVAASKFFKEGLDDNIPGANNSEGLINGDGWRCQYSDPDWPNSNSYGNQIALDCYPGPSIAGAANNYWEVDGLGTGAPDNGRSFTGNFSLYYGEYLGAESDFTTPMAAVESVATNNPINLGAGNPELSWWHQISLMDGRFLNIIPSRSADRGVIQYREVDGGGTPVNDWTNLQPFQNKYRTQDYDFYFNCMFDPVDDGTTEDDFFDDTDPERRLGPSSTCHPGFNFSCQGDTDDAFQVENICNATKPPTVGSHSAVTGTGTWVESKIDLSSLRGRRVELRWLVAGIKASSDTHEGQFADANPGEWDNGWWIDDIRINDTLTSPANLSVDTNVLQSCANAPSQGCLTAADCLGPPANGGLCAGPAPQCGATCAATTAVVTTDPEEGGGAGAETLSAPGQPIELDASGSTGTCLDGALQYKFSKNGSLIRDFSENPILVDAPADGDVYTVDVRCSTGGPSYPAACIDSTTVTVAVTCPDAGNFLLGEWPEETDPIRADAGKASFSWDTARGYELHVGAIAISPTPFSYAGSKTVDAGVMFPAPGGTTASSVNGSYYLVREVGEFCNELGSWSTGEAGEQAGRNSNF